MTLVTVTSDAFQAWEYESHGLTVRYASTRKEVTAVFTQTVTDKSIVFLTRSMSHVQWLMPPSSLGG